MFQTHRLYLIFSCAAVLLIASSVALLSQTTGRRAQALIHESVDENKLVTLAGNTRPEATAENDLGAVSDGLSLDHMMLQLKRSPQQEQAVVQFIAELHNSQSKNFHKWMTANDFGENYGLAEADIRTVKGWLESHGFMVNNVYPSGLVIDFSGNAGQVRRAFHTTIHNLDVNGVRHIANFSDPQIPEALAPAVAGVVSMHDFLPHKMIRRNYTFTLDRQTYQAVVPADLATIYDFNPLFAKGITGTGQTIAVIEDTDCIQPRGLGHLPKHLRACGNTPRARWPPRILRRRAELTIAAFPGLTGMMWRRASTQNGPARPPRAPRLRWLPAPIQMSRSAGLSPCRTW